MKLLIAITTCLLFTTGCGVIGIPGTSPCGFFAGGCGPPADELFVIANDTCMLTDSSDTVFDGTILLLGGLRDEGTSESEASASAMTFCVDECEELGTCDGSCDACVQAVVDAVYQ